MMILNGFHTCFRGVVQPKTSQAGLVTQRFFPAGLVGLLNVVTGIFVDSAVCTRTEDEVRKSSCFWEMEVVGSG